MTTRILALALSLVLCCSLLAGCSGDSGENQPAGGTTTGGANVTTTTVTEADGTTTTTVTTTESLTVQTDKDGNTVILDGNGNVIATGGEGDTVVTNADGSIVITDDKGSTVVITTSTTVNTTTTKAEPSQNGSSTTPTTTTKPDESKPTEPSGGDDPVDDPVKLYTGILPGSAQAGTAFSTLAKAPKDNTVTVANDTKQFGRFLLTTSDNKALPFNIACHMEGDRITALVPADVDLSKIKANFTYYGKNVTYNGADLISRSTVMDLTKDVTLTLNAKDGSSRQVTVHIEKLATGLPSMSMTTSGYSAITSTAEYKSAAFSIGGGDKAICSYATADQTKGADCSVKGRGNTSWG
ncbi:MAG: hypothetical protein J6R77_00595, partial [Clostridia bacterium]|nr:hypothetical protein [Clostridia bacterium]